MREIHDPPEQQEVHDPGILANARVMHFLLFIRAEEPKLILVHWFAPEDLHTNLSDSSRTERFALNWWW